MVSIVGASGGRPFQPREARGRPYLSQSRRWTFYETIFFSLAHSAAIFRCRAVGRLGIWMFTLTF